MKKNTLLLGTRKGLVVYEKNAAGWEYRGDHFLGVPVSLAACDARSHTWWAMLEHGHWGCKLHRSVDQGGSWQEITAPKYPAGEEIKPGLPATLKYLWAFAPGSADQPGRIYLGTEPGGLFSSDDNGNSFTLNRGLWARPERQEQWFGGGRDHPGIHSIVIDPKDDQHIYVAISCAGVFETRNGGASWQPRNKGLKADFLPDPKAEVGHDAHLLVACRAAPEVLWQQNHAGVYRSTDAGAHWQEVSGEEHPRFGFAIAADDQNSEVAWVIPAHKDECRVAIDHALRVCRTEDGGKSWQSFTRGLPQQASYDLVFRHALAVHGDTLAFGTTTGNVYLSEDRGEGWACLNNNLPPVYSCTFA